jgi:hypothetical protein
MLWGSTLSSISLDVTESTLKGAQGRAPPVLGHHADGDEILIRAYFGDLDLRQRPIFAGTLAQGRGAGIFSRRPRITARVAQIAVIFEPCASAKMRVQSFIQLRAPPRVPTCIIHDYVLC